MIEDHTHCSECGRVCFYPDKPVDVQKANSLKLCWLCYMEWLFGGGKNEV